MDSLSKEKRSTVLIQVWVPRQLFVWLQKKKHRTGLKVSELLRGILTNAMEESPEHATVPEVEE
jgi:hypothetical protein